ncbi:MAG: hypothetical protein ACLPHP_11560 [Candidatus Sulfotelmatobacter sp.]
MNKFHSIWTVGMLACALSAAWAQDSTTPAPSTEATPQSSQQQPVPAYGQEGAQTPITENPPLSGLDTPSLEPHAAPLSYLQPGATFSESADSNIDTTLGGQSVKSVSRGLGSLVLKRLWSHYDLALDYVGGVGYYDTKGQGLKQLQQMDLEQKIIWKRGQFAVRDSFSYLPEGNFGGAYGSLGSLGIGSLGGTAFSGFGSGAAFGTFGLAPRILNISMADITLNLTPKSALTAAGGYAFTHFLGNETTGAQFIGSAQTSGQVGYDRILTPHTQIAVVYGYQDFDFNVLGATFHSNVVQGMYGHRISGRMDLLLGAGPQFTRIESACTLEDALFGVAGCTVDQSGNPVGSIPNNKIGVAAQARLRYKFPKTNLDLSFVRFESSGSGLFAGAETNIVRLTAERPLTRVWSAFTDSGFAHNSRLQSLSPAELKTCLLPGQTSTAQPPPPPCPGAEANIYSYGFVGAGVHRAFGRTLHGYLSYQFNELAFDHSYCGGLPVCSRISNRNVATFGLDWTPRPIRLD